MTLEIRSFQPEDRDQWFDLWRQYLVFYEHELPEDISELTWKRLLAGDGPFYGLLAVHDDAVVGFAHYSFTHTTWEELPDVYGEDLFVSPAARSLGIGRALIEALTEVAQCAGASRLHWITQEGNHTARKLYDSLGSRTEFIIYERPTR